jgi:glycosyltransferase involved in cell wall biosynthesis
VKLLILTQYFPPETGAPQNRLFELAICLKNCGAEVTVLTAMPNYPKMEIFEAYEKKKYVHEQLDGLSVHRCSIFVSKNKSVLSRLRNYFSFVWSSAITGNKKLGNFDFLLCESPPLFLGYSALYLARRKKAKLIFNVSDLWPESAEKLSVVTNKFLLRLAYNLEAKLYKNAVLVSGQTQGICENISTRFPEVKTYWLPNGIDPFHFDPDKINPGGWRMKNNINAGDFVCLYAGIIGIAQGLEIILTAANHFRDKTHIKFVLMGSGPEKQRLENVRNEMGLTNVIFAEAVSRSEMPSVLKEINAAIIPLRKLDLFLGAIPSKIFENLSMKIPVLLGVDGEARQLFVDEGKCAIYFEPENSEELVKAICTLINNPQLAHDLGFNGRQYVIQYFNRKLIGEKFFEQLEPLIQRN